MVRVLTLVTVRTTVSFATSRPIPMEGELKLETEVHAPGLTAFLHALGLHRGLLLSTSPSDNRSNARNAMLQR